MAMVFAWIKNQRRKKLLSEPFPGGWRTYLHANVRHYQHLDARQRMAVEQVVQVSGAEKVSGQKRCQEPFLCFLGRPRGRRVLSSPSLRTIRSAVGHSFWSSHTARISKSSYLVKTNCS